MLNMTTAVHKGASPRPKPKLKCAWIPAPLYRRVQAYRQATHRTAVGVVALALEIGLEQLESEEALKRAQGRAA